MTTGTSNAAKVAPDRDLESRNHATQVEKLAQFVCRARWDEISEPARDQLKLRVLDSFGVALGALDGEPVAMIREQVQEFGGAPLCRLIGGGKSAPDRAALYNGALVRYLDFNDSYLAPPGDLPSQATTSLRCSPRPSTHADGRTLLSALAVAYQVQNRLSEVALVRAKGFDHTTQGAYAVAAGVSCALGLDARHTANAIAIAGTSLNALRVTRTGELSHWKGLAYPARAFAATHAAFLAMRGVAGRARCSRATRASSRRSPARSRSTGDKKTSSRSAARSSSASTPRSTRGRDRGAARATRRASVDGCRGRADRAGHLPGRVRHHRRRRGRRQAPRASKEEADHSLPYLARRRATRRSGAARAIPARADRRRRPGDRHEHARGSSHVQSQIIPSAKTPTAYDVITLSDDQAPAGDHKCRSTPTRPSASTFALASPPA